MKQKVGELNGKQIVVSANPEDVAYNEYLLEDTGKGIILKQRDLNGKLIEVTNSTVALPTVNIDTESVSIALNSTIVGPNKWYKGSNYLFYINKNDKFVITTTEGKKLNATLVATGKINKVYEIDSKECTSITIEEA